MLRRAAAIGGRQADDEQAVVDRLGRLGQRLSKGELSLEAAGRQITLFVQLPRVGDPLVDQYQARPGLDE